MVVIDSGRRFGRLTLAVLLNLAVIAGAQEAEPGDADDALARPRFMLYLFESEPDAFDDQELFVLYNSILSATAAASDAVVIVESPDPDVPPTQSGREGLARSADADSWLHVIVSGGFENLTVEVETFDLLRRRAFGRDVIRPGFVVDYRILTVGFWEGIEETLRTEYERIVDRTQLQIEALPGTTIIGLPDREREIDESGALRLSVAAQTAFSLTARLDGFYEEEREFFVGIEPTAIRFQQVEQPRYAFDVNISSLQFPGSRFWYYVVPARFFARTGVSTQTVGVFPIDNPESIIQTGSSLSFVSVDGGAYLNPPENSVRFYAAAGGYVRVVHPSLSDLSVENDASPGALTLTLGAEYGPGRRLRFFVEYQPAYIFARDPARFIDVSFVENTFPDGDVPGYIQLDRGLFDVRNVYVGARWDFRRFRRAR